MIELHNSKNEIEIRRCQKLLKTLSDGILVFGFWSTIKLILFAFIREDTSVRNVIDTGSTVRIVLSVFMLLFMIGLDIFIRVKIRRGSRREADGTAEKNGYLVLSALTMLGSAASVIIVIYGLLHMGELGEDQHISDIIVTLVVESTAFAMTFELIRAACRIRRLRREPDAPADAEAEAA